MLSSWFVLVLVLVVVLVVVVAVVVVVVVAFVVAVVVVFVVALLVVTSRIGTLACSARAVGIMVFLGTPTPTTTAAAARATAATGTPYETASISQVSTIWVCPKMLVPRATPKTIAKTTTTM
ncbi:unnamed protein product [Polarella glacialis]|uniref:Uncharacterized protein n=1 Tax=Polarella glacialis TaxID=89957 RepID=A0A813GUX6_POLGL|nr:unnamed protein product [Polarella glacialis]